MITLDTSAILAMVDQRENHHSEVVGAVSMAIGSVLIPSGILGEVCYHIESRLGQAQLAAFVLTLTDGTSDIDCGIEDLLRVHQLIERYADLPLGFADAAVIACAERNGGKVATLDHRHFGVVAREGTIQIVP